MKKALILLALFILFICCGAAGAAEKQQPAAATDRIIVKFKSGHQFQAAGLHARAIKGMRRAYSIPVKKGENIEQAMKAYRGRPDVEYVQPDYKRYACALPAVDDVPVNWGVARVGADELSRRLAGNNVAVVAVIDTGVYAGHELLSGKVLAGYDFVNNDWDADDDNMLGHGTHVAGIIAMVAGQQPVRVLPVKVLNAEGSGYDSAIADGIYYAVDRGADVINLSLGGPGSSPVLEEAVRYAVDQGVVVVAAAGNEASNAGNFSPANIEQCLTVSAVNRYDTITDFSNFGAVVDVSAPGKGIVSSVPPHADTDGTPDGYIAYNGTSMAAPFASGIAALLRVHDAGMDVQQVENLFAVYVDDVGDKGRDIYYGYGIINFENYLTDKLARVDIVSPGPYTEHYGTLQVRCSVSGSFTGSINFNVDGQLFAEKAAAQGETSVELDIAGLDEGEHTLSVSLVDSGGTILDEDRLVFVVAVPVPGISIQVYDMNGHPSAGATVYLLSIAGGGLGFIESKKTGSTGLVQFETGAGEGPYLALVYHETDAQVPLYMKQIDGPGDYSFKPQSVALMVLDYRVSANLASDKDLYLFPLFNGKPVGYFYMGTFYTGGHVPVEQGDYYLQIVDPGEGYYLFDRLAVNGDTSFSVTEEEIITLAVDYDFYRETPYAMPVPAELAGYYTWDFNMDMVDGLKLLAGDYTLLLDRYIYADGQQAQRYVFARDLNLEQPSGVQLGYTLAGSLSLDSDTVPAGEKLGGTVTIKDEHGNRLWSTNLEVTRCADHGTRVIEPGRDAPVEQDDGDREGCKVLPATEPVLPSLQLVNANGAVMQQQQVGFGAFEFITDADLEPGSYQVKLAFDPPGLQYTQENAVTLALQYPVDSLEYLYGDYRVLGPVRADTPLDHVFTVVFSAAVDPATATGESLKLYRYAGAVPVPVEIVQQDEVTFKLVPGQLLEPGQQYWVVVEPSIRGVGGSRLKEGVVTKFTTVPGS